MPTISMSAGSQEDVPGNGVDGFYRGSRPASGHPGQPKRRPGGRPSKITRLANRRSAAYLPRHGS